MGKRTLFFFFYCQGRLLFGVVYLSTRLQMKKLEKDLETKNMEKGALEARTTEAEKKVLELSSEVKNVCSSFYKSFIKVYAFIAIILNFYIFHC